MGYPPLFLTFHYYYGIFFSRTCRDYLGEKDTTEDRTMRNRIGPMAHITREDNLDGGRDGHIEGHIDGTGDDSNKTTG